jgi:PAS domain S-box-containing protein
MESLQNTILIIEDDLGLNELICEKMNECGYKTHSTLSALQANNWLSTNSPILMVVDYSLNDMTAKDFIVDMQEKGLELPPFIIATGQGDERIAVEMMKLGARDYIIKDTNLLDLLPTVIGRVVKEVENELKLKHAEQALIESEHFFKESQQAAGIGSYKLDTYSGLWTSSEILDNIFGIDSSFVRTVSAWVDIVFEDDREMIKNYFGVDVLEKKMPFDKEYRIKRISNNEIRWVHGLGNLVFDEKQQVITMRGTIQDITERKKMEEAIKFLINCGVTSSGEDFFESLAKYLAQILEMEYVCIDKLDPDGLTAHTLANYNDGKFDTNISYTLHQTPCGEAVGKTICCFPENVCKLFPNDNLLAEMNAESYVGTTLWSFDGKPIGLIAIIGRKPLKNDIMAENILRLVSVRASGELERNKAEQALRKKIDELNYMNKFMVNREVRMAEMKKEINEMLVSVGKEKRYL